MFKWSVLLLFKTGWQLWDEQTKHMYTMLAATASQFPILPSRLPTSAGKPVRASSCLCANRGLCIHPLVCTFLVCSL